LMVVCRKQKKERKIMYVYRCNKCGREVKMPHPINSGDFEACPHCGGYFDSYNYLREEKDEDKSA
jgi:DNA-directed RNA polymerase subunit RPC12/RpoP